MFHVQKKNDQLLFDIYSKPTDSFSYLHYHNYNLQHTKNNVVLPLGQRITQIVSENMEQHHNKSISCLIQRGHPEKVLDYIMTKLLSPSFKSQNRSIEYITFAKNYKPNSKFNKNINNSDFHNNLLKKAFKKN